MKDKTTLEYERRIADNAKKAKKLAEDAKALYREGQKLKRDARTHHLCNLGGMLETYLKEPGILEEDDVRHKRAYGYLMKNHGGKLEVTPSEFDAELHRMKQEDAAATADLESIKGQLTEMKKLKRKLEKSTPELAREDRSVREQLTRTPERTPERNTPRKPTTQKKHDQAR